MSSGCQVNNLTNNRTTAYLAGVLAALRVPGAEEDVLNGLEVRPVTVLVGPHRQLHLLEGGALCAVCGGREGHC